jgi:hypothetical protein
VDGVSFDGGPSSLAALDTCPVADKALLRKLALPCAIGDLRTEQVRANPEGHRYFVDNAYLAGETGSLIPAMTPAFTSLPTEKAFSLWFDLAHLPGRDQPDMAQSLQTDLYFATYVVCEDAADDALCRSWVDLTMARLEPFSAGCYLGDSDFTVRPAPFMSDPAWSRFRTIRAARDPEGLFPGYLYGAKSPRQLTLRWLNAKAYRGQHRQRLFQSAARRPPGHDGSGAVPDRVPGGDREQRHPAGAQEGKGHPAA